MECCQIPNNFLYSKKNFTISFMIKLLMGTKNQNNEISPRLAQSVPDEVVICIKRTCSPGVGGGRSWSVLESERERTPRSDIYHSS